MSPVDELMIDVDIELMIEAAHFRIYLNSVLGAGHRAQQWACERLACLKNARSDEMCERLEREDRKLLFRILNK